MNEEKSELERLAWRPSEVAKMLGVSLPYIRKEIRAENLKAKKFGRAVSILKVDLDEYINSKENFCAENKD